MGNPVGNPGFFLQDAPELALSRPGSSATVSRLRATTGPYHCAAKEHPNEN